MRQAAKHAANSYIASCRHDNRKVVVAAQQTWDVHVWMGACHAGVWVPGAAWVACWSSTLDALATAARDPRLGVRCHALYLLTEALLDKQSE